MPLTDARIVLQDVAGNEPQLQWNSLNNLDHLDLHVNATNYDALLDFAADPDSSVSLMVRAKAMDAAIRLLHHARSDDDTRPWLSELASQQSVLHDIIPNYFDSEVYRNIIDDPSAPKRNTWHAAYHYHMYALCQEEGLYKATVFDHLCAGEDSGDIYSELPDSSIPLAPFMLLDRIIGPDSSTVRYMPHRLVRDGLELALDFRSKDYQEALLGQGHFAQFARLARLTHAGGFEHDEPIEYLYTLPKDEGMVYAAAFNQLYEAAAGLQDIFPPAVSQEVVQGARALVANGLFAVSQHHQNNLHTEAEILLKNGFGLSVHFEDQEPLDIIRQLTKVFHELQTTVTAPTTGSIVAVNNPGFTIFRLLNTLKPEVPKTMLYLRAFGAPVFDSTFEYGRRGEGVEASISYIVDMSERLPLLEKRRRSLGNISIRLDREGESAAQLDLPRDPTRMDGTISLDVGSVLGEETNFGTKVGRLLGWGNMLHAQKAHKEASLNHIKSLDQTYGEAAAFARITEQMYTNWRGRAIGLQALQNLFSSPLIAVQG